MHEVLMLINLNFKCEEAHLGRFLVYYASWTVDVGFCDEQDVNHKSKVTYESMEDVMMKVPMPIMISWDTTLCDKSADFDFSNDDLEPLLMNDVEIDKGIVRT